MARRDKLWYLSRMDLFRALDQEAMEHINRISEMTELKKRTLVHMAGQPLNRLYLVKRGFLKVYVLTDDGKENVLDYLRPGDVFGELSGAAEDDTPDRHFVEVHEDALVCIVARKDFMSMMRRYPDLAFQVTKFLGLRLRRLNNRMEPLLFKSSRARIAQTLVRLAEQYGVRDAQGVLLTIKLSQQELGSLVGLSRESTNLCLGELRREGLIELKGRRLRLRDTERLAAIQ